MKVIAISGWKRSGKDTAAAYLIDKGFTRTSFADALKDMVAEEYRISRDHCDNPEYKEAALQQYPVIPKDEFSLNMAKMMYKEFRTINGSQALDYYIDPSGAFLGVMGRHTEQLYWTPRALCILKGSVNRSVDSSYWVQTVISKIITLAIPPDHIHPKDYNNPNFVISDLRFRSEIDQLRQALGKKLITVRINRFDTINSNDASERDLDNTKFDVVIDNKSSLEDLYKQLDKLLE